MAMQTEKRTSSQCEAGATTEAASQSAKRWVLILWNDSVNEMSDVTDSLMRCLRLPHSQAFRIMLEAHQTGRAVAGVYPREEGEFRMELLSSCGLTVSLEAE